MKMVSMMVPKPIVGGDMTHRKAMAVMKRMIDKVNDQLTVESRRIAPGLMGFIYCFPESQEFIARKIGLVDVV